ncbi:MAG: Flp family type IVb pilin [Phycisphaerae bacterium]|nr:Flp family type IVb pilin [Phycisphaerae bacterium]
MLKSIVRTCKALHRDEQGADLIEYILIVAAVALPLLGVIIWYRNDIAEWIQGSYEDVKSGEGTQTPEGN